MFFHYSKAKIFKQYIYLVLTYIKKNFCNQIFELIHFSVFFFRFFKKVSKNMSNILKEFEHIQFKQKLIQLEQKQKVFYCFYI